jgi:hypothetical protein
MYLIESSCPRIAVRRTASLRSPMSRASTSLMPANKDVDGRNKSGHDEPWCVIAARLRGCAIPARSRGRGEMVDARDLKSLGSNFPCRFKSGRPHQIKDLVSVFSRSSRLSRLAAGSRRPCGRVIPDSSKKPSIAIGSRPRPIKNKRTKSDVGIPTAIKSIMASWKTAVHWSDTNFSVEACG